MKNVAEFEFGHVVQSNIVFVKSLQQQSLFGPKIIKHMKETIILHSVTFSVTFALHNSPEMMLWVEATTGETKIIPNI